MMDVQGVFHSKPARQHTPPAEFVTTSGLALPLGTPVRVNGGGDGVISGRAVCGAERWRVSTFVVRDKRVAHVFYTRQQFTVTGSAADAADEAAPAT